MQVTIELDKTLVSAIADKMAIEHAYDWSTANENDINDMYASAFYDGAMYILNLVEPKNS